MSSELMRPFIERRLKIIAAIDEMDLFTEFANGLEGSGVYKPSP